MHLQSQPDENFQKYLPNLLQYPNAKVIGYISTQYGDRDESAVQTDISTYANWGSSYAVHGIFFDEVKDGLLEKYTGYTGAVKAGMGEDAFVGRTDDIWKALRLTCCTLSADNVQSRFTRRGRLLRHCQSNRYFRTRLPYFLADYSAIL